MTGHAGHGNALDREEFGGSLFDIHIATRLHRTCRAESWHCGSIANVKRYLDVRLAEGAARESIRKELTTLRAALREAVALGWMTKAQSIDAIPDFKVQYKPRTRWLTRTEYAKLLDALEMVELPAGKNKRRQKIVVPSPRLGLRVLNGRLWVAIAVGLGTRRREVESLDWAGIDLDAGILANHGTKTKGSDRAPADPGRAARGAA